MHKLRCALVALQHQLVETWTGFQQSILNEVIKQWHNRHCTCVRAEEDHFKHLL